MATSFLQNNEDSSSENITPAVPGTLEPVSPPEIDAAPQDDAEEYDMSGSLPETHTPEDEHFLEEEPTEDLDQAKSTIQPVQTVQKATPQNIAIPKVRDDLTIQIEKIMEEDLADVFSALTPQQKQQFKIKGEATALKIKDLLRGAKVKLGKIVKLIFDWLNLLPGINRFFLEQEAKIKGEKIVNLHEQQKHLS